MSVPAPFTDAGRQLRHVIEHLREVFFETDVEGRWTYLNPAWTVVTGFSVQESLGLPFSDFVWPDDLDVGVARFKPLVAGEWEYSRHEVRYRTSSGGSRWIEVHAQVVVDDNQDIVGTSGTLRDVTAQRDLSEQVMKAREAAVAASQAKSDFLANMSHEIRTPMNGVIGLTDLLLDTALTGEQREYADGVKQSAEALLTIINDILDFSKIEAGKLSIHAVPHDLHQVVREAVNLVDIKARNRGFRVALDLDGRVPALVDGDPVRIRQVLINLIDNAVKFTHAGGVTVSVAPDATSMGSAAVRFAITDTGIGIDQEKLEAIFEKFTQADASTTRRYGGSGLGLAICKQLVELMGGDIGVTSEPGKGSTFWFRLSLQEVSPVSPGAATHAARTDGGQPHASGDRERRYRTLVVEDSAINMKVARKMLEKLGCDVEVAENGAIAVDMVKTTSYDVVFMDCQMPVLDGYEATAAIRRLGTDRAQTRIVAMTAHAMAADRDRCLAAGMNGYVAKPVSADDLRRVFRDMESANEPRMRAPAPGDRNGESGHAPSFDRGDLLSRMDGDAEIIADLVTLLTADGPAYVTSLKAALDAGDAVAAARIVHTLKGSVGHFSAPQCVELAKQVEHAIRNGDLGQARELTLTLDRETARLVRELQAWAATLKT